jgi:hypothetical protein
MFELKFEGDILISTDDDNHLTISLFSSHFLFRREKDILFILPSISEFVNQLHATQAVLADLAYSSVTSTQLEEVVSLGLATIS